MKYFSIKHIEDKDLRTLVCKFIKAFGVKKVVFSKTGKYVKGTYNATTRVMYINLDQNPVELMHAVFHELAHHVAVKNKMWLDYHYSKCITITPEEVFDIENNIDKIAQQLWYANVNTRAWGKYMFAYPRKNKDNIIKTFILEWYQYCRK